MAGRIPQTFIDELVSRVDIVELIHARVPLKKAGRDYHACCPFHSEKTPSFTVSPAKQFYHCFGCGAHGTALGFLMEFDKLEFREAVKVLAEQAGVEVPDTGEKSDGAGFGPLYSALEQAAALYRRQLKDSPRAVEYLKKRGLTGEIAAEFGIGYAPEAWDTVTKALGGDAAGRDALVAAGMAIKRDSGTGFYDRFRDRIMFPIRDNRGRVIAFGGRVIDQGEPKYLNSPETPLFHKGRELYGLYEARQAQRELSRLIVVEGYMDVVALAQSGIRYAVATLGTATTAEHLNRLFRVVDEVAFCFDGDRAGRAAAWRALENALPAVQDGRELKFLFLPEGEDPDTLVRKEGREAFEARLGGAKPLSEYFVEQLSAQVDLATAEGQAKLFQLAKPLLARLPESAYRTLLEDRLGTLTKLGAARLAGRVSAPAPAGRGDRPATRPSRSPMLTAPRRAIALLLQSPALAGIVEDPASLRSLDPPGTELLADLIEFFRARPGTRAAAALEHWRGTEKGGHLEKLATLTLETPEVAVEADFRGLIENFRRLPLDKRYAELKARDPRTLTPDERAEFNSLLKTLKK
jgi:DNA primase